MLTLSSPLMLWSTPTRTHNAHLYCNISVQEYLIPVNERALKKASGYATFQWSTVFQEGAQSPASITCVYPCFEGQVGHAPSYSIGTRLVEREGVHNC